MLVPRKQDISPARFKSLLPHIMIVRMDPDEDVSKIQLIGEEAKVAAGFSGLEAGGQGFNINSMAPDEYKEGWLERQRAYHDHPVAKVDLYQFIYRSEIANFVELTYCPVWGSSGERLLYVLAHRNKVPVELQLKSMVLKELRMVEEVLIDIGAGIPRFRSETV